VIRMGAELLTEAARVLELHVTARDRLAELFETRAEVAMLLQNGDGVAETNSRNPRSDPLLLVVHVSGQAGLEISPLARDPTVIVAFHGGQQPTEGRVKYVLVGNLVENWASLALVAGAPRFHLRGPRTVRTIATPTAERRWGDGAAHFVRSPAQIARPSGTRSEFVGTVERDVE
jgi:hypothetical protein